jgi:hypothetical protein
MIKSGIITTEVARQIAVDEGYLDERYLRMMGETNATTDVTGPSTEYLPSPDEPVKRGMAGPKEAPGGKPPAAPNSNDKRVTSPATSQRRNPGG